MADYPLAECAQAVDEILAKNPSVRTYMKWTCTHCGARLTMDEPNTFYLSGTCDACGGLTDPITHCNYLLVASLGEDV